MILLIHRFQALLPGGEVRQLVFGSEGRGMVTYLVLEDQQLVDVLVVQWVGE